jgi:hypothetical protein
MQSKLNALAFTILRDSQASDMERQAKLQHAAHYWKDQHTGHTSNPADYTWLEFDLPPTYFNEMSQSDWEKWFKDEVDMWREEGRPNRFDDMKAPIREAVVATIEMVERNETLLIWDGYHRVGAARTHGHAYIPVIVGVRKKNA